MPTDKNLPETGFLTTKCVKRRLKISNSTLYNWIREQRLPAPYRIGPRAVRFRVEDIRSFEEKLEKSKAAAE